MRESAVDRKNIFDMLKLDQERCIFLLIRASAFAAGGLGLFWTIERVMGI